MPSSRCTTTRSRSKRASRRAPRPSTVQSGDVPGIVGGPAHRHLALAPVPLLLFIAATESPAGGASHHRLAGLSLRPDVAGGRGALPGAHGCLSRALRRTGFARAGRLRGRIIHLWRLHRLPEPGADANLHPPQHRAAVLSRAQPARPEARGARRADRALPAAHLLPRDGPGGPVCLHSRAIQLGSARQSRGQEHPVPVHRERERALPAAHDGVDREHHARLSGALRAALPLERATADCDPHRSNALGGRRRSRLPDVRAGLRRSGPAQGAFQSDARWPARARANQGHLRPLRLGQDRRKNHQQRESRG